MITVEVTDTGVSLSKVASDMPNLAKTMLKKAVGYAKGRAEELTPVRTGLMKQNWYVTSQGDLEGTLSNRAPYFLFFIEGTAPHQIRPKFASTLRARRKETLLQTTIYTAKTSLFLSQSVAISSSKEFRLYAHLVHLRTRISRVAENKYRDPLLPL